MEKLLIGFNPLSQPIGDTDTVMDLGELPENHFRGVASVFGHPVDAYMPTIIHRGAFKKTLAEGGRKALILWQHDSNEPIGKPVKMFESEEGLVIEAAISRTTRGRDALQLMRDGVITALSIGFDSIKEDMETLPDGAQIRHVREIRLWEISLVSWGADSLAAIREVNSHNGKGKPVVAGREQYAELARRVLELCCDASADVADIAALLGETVEVAESTSDEVEVDATEAELLDAEFAMRQMLLS